MSSVAFGRVALVTERLDVADVVATSTSQRNDVVFSPDVAISPVWPPWDILPKPLTPWALVEAFELFEPLASRV